MKVVCPLSSVPDGTSDEGALVSFGNTAAGLRRGILGADAVGGREAVRVTAKYSGALAKGHTVVPCIFEVFGGFDGGAVDLLNACMGRQSSRQDASG
jgi:hypothetical protein